MTALQSCSKVAPTNNSIRRVLVFVFTIAGYYSIKKSVSAVIVHCILTFNVLVTGFAYTFKMSMDNQQP